MVAESAAVFLRPESLHASINAVLIHVDDVDGFCIPAQIFSVSSVTAGKLQRRLKIFVFDDGPDRSFPLKRHELFGMSKIQTGPVAGCSFPPRYPTNNFLLRFPDDPRSPVTT